MKTRSKLSIALSIPLFIGAGAGALAAGAAPPGRMKLTCDGYARMAKGIWQHYTPGSWGSVPPELRTLPPGAQHCGADSPAPKAGTAVILSSLAGDDLKKFYAPLFAKVGCQPLECDITKTNLGGKDREQTRCTCHGDKMLGVVATDTGAEVYVLSLISLAPR